MSDLNIALGRSIIEGGIARVAADTALYGDASRVVLSTARMQTLLLDVATKAEADPFRIMLANKLGELAVASLYGGDISSVLERGIADIARMAPLADLQLRAAARRQDEEMQKRIDQARGPAQPAHQQDEQEAEDEAA